MFSRLPAPGTQRRLTQLAALLLLFGISAAAQTARNVGIVSDAERQRFGFDPAESAGLFIGIREFDDPHLTEVPYAVDDAIDLAHLFAVELALIPPSKVVLALSGKAQKPASRDRLRALTEAGANRSDPTRPKFFTLLRSQAAAAGRRGLFVVSVASHGFLDGGAANLVTSDAVRSDIALTGFRLDHLLARVAASSSPRQLVLLDACRERLTKARRVGEEAEAQFGQPFVEAIEQARGQVVLAAATRGGFAYDDPERKNGVFTAAILDGLRGGAPADTRGLINVESLAGFADARVVSWVRRHRPEHIEQSRGITTTMEGPAAALPLAVDRQFTARAELFGERKAKALDKLKREIGGVITGRMFDDVSSLLASATETDAGPWLDRIEALDSTQGPRESLAYHYSKHFESSHFDPPLPSPSSSREPRPGDVWTEKQTGMRFRYIPAGTFLVGSPSNEVGRDTDETQREVTLTKGYWMGETEVTQGQWRALMGTNPSRFNACGDECPIEQVNWFEAIAFANVLSEKAGWTPCYRVSGGNGKKAGEALEYETVDLVPACDGFRLPTEAEWERAARAETKTALYTGDLMIEGERNGPQLDSIAWYGGNSGVGYSDAWDCSDWPERQRAATTCGTHPVGQKHPNEWGLYDPLGNVLEWTWDWYSSEPKGELDPIGPEDGRLRVIRGGSWYDHARHVRAAYRIGLDPGYRSPYVGFRLSRGP